MDRGIDINSKDIYDDTVLQIAAKYGHMNIVEILLVLDRYIDHLFVLDDKKKKKKL